MKFMSTLICVLLCMSVLLCGCTAKTEGSLLFPAGEIASVHMVSLPEKYDYVLEGRNAARVVEYLKGLTLIADFEENPNLYNGMAWVITLCYADGSEHQVVHFGNMFIHGEDATWYKMHYEEAAQLEVLLEELVGFEFP